MIHHAVSEHPRFPASLPAIWNVPPRNTFFTGREEILQRLQASFAVLNTRALTKSQAISGLGGIGKTQIAIEYAYRSVNDYQAVLWATADSRNALATSCLNIAHQLDLPEKDARDHNEIVSAVREWLQNHVDWLLILDNADDPYIVRDFLPSAAQGHTLITTRAQAMGKVAQGMIVDEMMPEEGALFLLRRAGMLGTSETLDASDPECQDAMHIAQIMDGLPLALDQAGAYVEEVGCSMADYLALYKDHRKYLLQQRGKLIFDHPEPVATTWALSFEQVQQANPAAAGLLRLCAFLSPDDIPEEVIAEGTADLGSELKSLVDNPLAINNALAELRRYSLVRRHPENKTLSIHRLVQTVLIDTMDKKEQRLWAERAVRALNRVFPEVKFETWKLCQRYLSHAQACVTYIDLWNLAFPQAADLLRRAGTYLRERAQYAEAKKWYQRSLRIFEQSLGPDHLDVAYSLRSLANVYSELGQYEDAEKRYQRSLHIFEQSLGPDHLKVAPLLNNLAILSKVQGKYEEAEQLYKHSLSIWEQNRGPDHPDVAQSLNNLAVLYAEQGGKYATAAQLFKRSLHIREQSLGPEHPDVAQSLNNLANLCTEQGKYAKALQLFQRSLRILGWSLRPENSDVAQSLNNLANLDPEQSKYVESLYQRSLYEEAESLYQRSLHIFERSQGPKHPDVAYPLNGLAILRKLQGKYEEAERLYQRSLDIWKQSLGPEHPQVAYSLNNLAVLYTEQGKYEEAERLYQRSLDIWKQSLGPKHPDTLKALHNLASLLREMQRSSEAAELEARIRKAQGDDTEEQ